MTAHGAAASDAIGPFAGGGEMAATMAAVDWSRTSLGPVDSWPQSLRTSVDLCLSSRAPMMVVWGPDHVQLYNDALAPLMGDKHPAAVGRPYAETFREIWDDLQGPLLRAVHERGESAYIEDAPVFFHRRVPNEEMYWTFSWSPIRGERGEVAGALHPAVETTARVLAERRVRLLRDLATATAQSESLREACRRAVESLTAHPLDLPFCAVYLIDPAPMDPVPVTARLAAVSGVDDVAAVFPGEVDLTATTFTAWPLAAAAATRAPQVSERLQLDVSALSGWPWPEPPATAVTFGVTRPGRSDPVALLVVGLSPRRPLDREHRDFLELVGSQFGTALASAASHEQHRQVALTLQRSMLPDTSCVVTGLDVAARYIPGSSDTEVGGDWYDVIALGGDRTAVVIGDVMGRGVHAAAVMGQVRSAVRAYAQLDLPPEEVLTLMDRLVVEAAGAQDIGQIVTCTYGVHDAATGTVTLASAGHPPALLFGPDRAVACELASGPPLGVGGARYSSSSYPLSAGEGLLLYTDGLIETRDGDLDESIDALAKTVSAWAGEDDLERLADAVLAVQPAAAKHDDLTLLAVRVPRAGESRCLVVDLHSVGRATRTARRSTVRTLHEWGVPAGVVDAAELVVAELVSNAVTHAGRLRHLRLRALPTRLVIEVADANPAPPTRTPGEPADEGGRGLLIVGGLAAEWGVRLPGYGKVVWCELPFDTAGP